MTQSPEKVWKNIMECGKRKFQNSRSTDSLTNDFVNDFLKYDFSDCGVYRPECNVFIARNKQRLAYVASFFEICAEYGRLHVVNGGKSDVTATFENIYTELDGALEISLGPMSFKDGGLKFTGRKDKDVVLLVLELIAYSLELRMLFDGNLPNPHPLEEVINSDVLEEGKGFLSKLGLGSGKKALLKQTNDPLNNFEVIDMPSLNLGDIILEQKEDGFSQEKIEDLSERNAYFLAKFKNVEPHLMPFYVTRMLDQPADPEQSFKIENSNTLVAELRAFFPEEDMQDSLVQEALEKCDYIPEAAANWIVEQRKASVDLLCSKFPSFTKARAAVIGEKCKYDKNMMLILANVDIMNKVEKTDRIDELPRYLTDITIPVDLRIEVATLELFGDIQMFDSNIRARKLIELLSLEDENNRPRTEGWWESFENYSFEDLVSFMCDAPDPSIPDLFRSSILNNMCDICSEYYHKNKIIEFECGCYSCVQCVLHRLRVASDGSNLEEAMLCPKADCPQKDMNEEDKRNAFNLRYQQLCAFGQQFPEHKEVFDRFVESYNRHAALLLANFTLCAHPPCKNGQVQGDPNNLCMTCHECRKKTCYSCKNQWFDEHVEKNCQEYAVWLRKKHPDIAGLSSASDPFSFITCPECQGVFHLQRGGCLHFICRTCKTHFCGFCSRIFFNKDKPCRECEPSKQNSLHAHHPRNCFYYLRDEALQWLIDLLDECEVDWKENIPKIESTDGKCPVKIVMDGETEEHPCGSDPAMDGFTFCEKHFKEFLSIIIYENKAVDPIKKLDMNYLVIICKRENIEIPPNATEDVLRENIAMLSPLDDEAEP